jgi:glucosamine--fructose-6-phosphate aminotransferase (isomerizing)
METKYLRDILRQPSELGHVLHRALGPGRRELERAASLIRDSRDVYLAGIGASWNAGLALLSFFSKAGRPAAIADASELMHQTSFRPGSAVLALSRSGKSVEMVRLGDLAAAHDLRLVAVTNAPESPLAAQADAVVLTDVGFDHGVSVVAYSAIALAGALVAASATGTLDAGEIEGLGEAIRALPQAITTWREQIRGSNWFSADAPTYFLGRGASLASAHEAMLLWEEAAKSPASALTTGGFRHGPQEAVAQGLRVGIWIDGERRREEDLRLARDLRRLGARVMLIGRAVPEDAGDLVFNVPAVPASWQFVVDVVPAQLAAEQLSHLRGVDCDTFRLCSYVVESEGGLLDSAKAVPTVKGEKA